MANYEEIILMHSDVIQPGGCTQLELQKVEQKQSFNQISGSALNLGSQNLAQLLIPSRSSFLYVIASHNQLNNFQKILVPSTIVKLDLSHNKFTTINIQQFWEKLPKLRFLCLNNNRLDQIDDIYKMTSLTQLLQISLFDNPLSSDPRYFSVVTKVFPGLKFLDNQIITPLESYYVSNYDFQQTDLKLLIRYSQSNFFKNKFIEPSYVSKDVLSKQIRTQTDLDLENHQQISKLDVCHDYYASPVPHQIQMIQQLRTIIFAIKMADPVVAIQRLARGYIYNYRTKSYRLRRDVAVVSIQIALRYYMKNKSKVSEKIKMQKVRNSAAIVIQCQAKRLINDKLLRITFWQETAAINAVITIQAAMRRLRTKNQTMQSKQIQSQVNQDLQEQFTFAATLTYETMENAAKLLKNLLRGIFKDVHLQLKTHAYCPNGPAPLADDFFTFRPTCFRLLDFKVQEEDAESNTLKVGFSRKISFSEAFLRSMRTDLHGRAYREVVRMRKIGRKSDQNTASDAALLVSFKEMIVQLKNSNEKSPDKPLFAEFTIRHRELGAVFFYLLQAHGVFFKQQPLTESQQNAFEFGKYVVRMLLSRNISINLLQMFETTVIPVTYGKNDIRAQFVAVDYQQLISIAAAISIQKQFRMIKSNRGFIHEFKKLTNLSFPTSVHQIIAVQRATVFIQKFLRGFISKSKQLILLKVKEAICSSLQYGYFLMRKDILQQLRSNSLKPNVWWRDSHVVITEPVSIKNASNIFATENMDFDVSYYFKQLYYQKDQLYRQLILRTTLTSEILSSLGGTFYANSHQINEGFIMLQGEKQTDHPLCAYTLHSWTENLKYLEKGAIFQPFAVKLKTQPKSQCSQQENIIDNEIFEVLCGIKSEKQSFQQGEQLVKAFNIHLQKEVLDYSELNKQILNNLQFQEYQISNLPSCFRRIGQFLIKDLVTVKIDSCVYWEDLILKAAVLELTYCEPRHHTLKECGNFTSRKWDFLTQFNHVTISSQVIQLFIASQIIQSIYRGLKQRQLYRQTTKHTKLCKKIEVITTADITKPNKKLTTEKAAINMLDIQLGFMKKQEINTNQAKQNPYFQNFNSMEIKAPQMSFLDRREKLNYYKQRNMAESNFELSISQQVKNEKVSKLAQENCIRCQVVKEVAHSDSDFWENKKRLNLGRNLNSQNQPNYSTAHKIDLNGQLPISLKQLPPSRGLICRVPNYIQSTESQQIGNRDDGLVKEFVDAVSRSQAAVNKVQIDMQSKNRLIQLELHKQQQYLKQQKERESGAETQRQRAVRSRGAVTRSGFRRTADF